MSASDTLRRLGISEAEFLELVQLERRPYSWVGGRVRAEHEWEFMRHIMQPVLGDVTLAAAAASIDFSGIPTGFAHLRLVASLRTAVVATGEVVSLRFNGDAGANYDAIATVFAHNAAFVTFEAIGGTLGYCMVATGATATADSFATNELLIPDYLSALKKRSWLASGTKVDAEGTGLVTVSQLGGKWRSTAAINRVTLISNAGANFSIGSRVTLYGVR